MVITSKTTGEQLPRAYGLVVRIGDGFENVFFSPFRAVLAHWMLLTPAEKKERIYGIADKVGVAGERWWSELEKAVQEKDGTMNLLTHGRRRLVRGATVTTNLAIDDVAVYGNELHAQVKSRSGIQEDTDGRRLVKVFSRSPSRPHFDDITAKFPDCSCPDCRYNANKKTRTGMACVHSLCLEEALAYDNTTKLPVAANITGLPPTKREPFTRSGVFSLHEGLASLTQLDEERKIIECIIAECVYGHYVRDESQFSIDRELTTYPNVYNPNVLAKVGSNIYRVRFEALRQKEKKAKDADKNTTDTHGRMFGAYRQHYEKIVEKLRRKNFVSRGRTAERYGGIDYIFDRFEPKTTPATMREHAKQAVLVLRGMKNDERYLPPIVVKRMMIGSTQDPYKNPESKLDIMQCIKAVTVNGVDDVTRRACTSQFLLPGFDYALTTAGKRKWLGISCTQTVYTGYKNIGRAPFTVHLTI